MDTALTILDVLRQIYALRDAIRHQRRKNRKTYLRMMEVYVELQLSEPLQTNPTLQRTQAIKKFAGAVDSFTKYLKKYHDMHRVVRMFKHTSMEEKRLKIVDEIDKLCRMLNLATAVTVMNGQAAASSNAARLFAKLEDMHSDIRLTHNQIHAALLAAKQQFELTMPKMLSQREPSNRVGGKAVVRQAPILKKYTPMLDKKPSLKVEDPSFDMVVEHHKIESPAMEEKSMACAKPALEQNAIDELDQNVTEDKASVVTKSESEQSAGDVVVEMKNPTIKKAALVVLKQTTAIDDDDEEKEPIKQEPVLVQTNAEEDEPQEEEEKETTIVKEKQQEEEEEKEPVDQEPELIESSTDKATAELEKNVMKETVDETPPQQATTSLLDSSVPQLIQLLGSDQATSQEKEQILLHLVLKCITNSNRVQIYKTKGIPVLTDLVRNSKSFFTRLYALHCLSWFTFSFSKMRESEFMDLQNCVREPTHPEILSLLHELQYGDEKLKEVAALQSSCIATRGDGDVLRQVGVLSPLLDLLADGTDNQKLWAAETLVTLASDSDESCVAIAREGAIPPLVELLRSGTDMQKQEAAYALGNLAATNEANRGKIAREGAIPPMVAFVKAETDAQSHWAVYALGFLSLGNEENRVLIAQEGAIPHLVALLRSGTRAQKQWSAYTLGNLAHNDANRVKITLEGAITPLIELLRDGTEMQKQRAAFALGNLACDNDVATGFDAAILPLVELVRTGSDTQKEDAAYTLGNLAANNNDRSIEIGRKGAIAPLVRLLESGNDDQKQWAAFALRCLAKNNDSNRVAIVEEGAIAPLAALMEEGNDEQEEQAAHALKHLVPKSDTTDQTFAPDRIMTPLMGYFRAGVEATSQNVNVAAAVSTFENVRDGVIPLFHKLVKPGVEAQNQPGSTQPKSPALKPADSKAENDSHNVPNAW